MTNVVGEPVDDLGCPFDLAHDGVATATEQTSHSARFVAVVHDKQPCGLVAEETTPTLGTSQVFNLGRRELVPCHADVLLEIANGGPPVSLDTLTERPAP